MSHKNQTISNGCRSFCSNDRYAGESLLAISVLESLGRRFIQNSDFRLIRHKNTKSDSKRLVPAALTYLADGLIIGSGAFENYAIALLKIEGVLRSIRVC